MTLEERVEAKKESSKMYADRFAERVKTPAYKGGLIHPILGYFHRGFTYANARVSENSVKGYPTNIGVY